MTALFAIVGAICIVIGTWDDWRGERRLLNLNIAQIYQEARAGRLPKRPPWRQALLWLGFGLFGLSLLRQWAGV